MENSIFTNKLVSNFFNTDEELQVALDSDKEYRSILKEELKELEKVQEKIKKVSIDLESFTLKEVYKILEEPTNVLGTFLQRSGDAMDKQMDDIEKFSNVISETILNSEAPQRVKNLVTGANSKKNAL